MAVETIAGNTTLTVLDIFEGHEALAHRSWRQRCRLALRGTEDQQAKLVLGVVGTAQRRGNFLSEVRSYPITAREYGPTCSATVCTLGGGVALTGTADAFAGKHGRLRTATCQSDPRAIRTVPENRPGRIKRGRKRDRRIGFRPR